MFLHLKNLSFVKFQICLPKQQVFNWIAKAHLPIEQTVHPVQFVNVDYFKAIFHYVN
jgi:hypothetical protein